ncbi:nucleotidyltransferase [Campylobacter sp. US33a]|uniref:nucleotidyltransferase n=1 Tax=Campylobacter sp. US33a TaxID=2498120 RepID=UPI00106753D0|nr:nucleotidyltransferase [Campylobacter sp. US33a]TEY00513.1 nucleotidyltransferase [Campylobacter sp. US33a]
MKKDIEKVKLKLNEYFEHNSKYFTRQGAFSLHHSKQIDGFIKKIFEIVLQDCFEDFFPSIENIPFCMIATRQYARHQLCAYESVDLLFVYKDIKAYDIKPMIKNLIAFLNDVRLPINYQICELNGLSSIAKNELKQKILQHRFLCGSKRLFKIAKQKFEEVFKEYEEEFAEFLFAKFEKDNIPFIKQEFDIKKDFGGLLEYGNLDLLLTLFKHSSKNYALEFISEKELSELRLASDFLLSLQSAMNINAQKDVSVLSLNDLNDISRLLHKKDKKYIDAKTSLLQKAMQSMHTTGIYVYYLLACMQRDKNFYQRFLDNGSLVFYEDKIYTTKNFIKLKDALRNLNSLEDKELEFDISVVFALKRLKFSKMDLEQSFLDFRSIFYRKHSFGILKLLLDSALLYDLFKPFMMMRFILNDEGVYSVDEQAFLALYEFEKLQDNEILQSLSADEKMILKIVILMSALREENEISLGNIYRAYCAKLELSNEILEFGLKFLKNYNAMKDIIEKEDIYNPIIVCTLLSKIENLKNLDLLALLTLNAAKASNCASHFFIKSLDKLVLNAKTAFEDENLIDETSRRVKKEQTLKRSKIFIDLSPNMQDKIAHIKSNLFFIKNSFEDIVKIALIANENSSKFWFNNEKNLIFEMTANKGLNLEKILSALANLNLVFMSFFELFDEKIYLKFEYNNIISDEQKQNLAFLLEANLHKNDKNKALAKPIIKKEELKFDLEYSKTYAKLSINAKDQQGLMAYVMNVFNEFKLDLSAAKIQTIRQRTRNIYIFRKDSNLIEQRQNILKSLISE